MNVAEYIIERLAREGIDTAFLVYGGAISDLVDALPGRMRYVVAVHEQAAGFMAEGYAKAKRVPGLAIATSGPGGGNLVTPIQNCYYDSTACIFLTGQVATRFVRPNTELRQLGFQETPIVSIVKEITKYAAQAGGPLHAAFCLETAILEASHGRPGPVLLDIPNDVQRMAMPDAETPSASTAVLNARPEVHRFMRDLAVAERPAILVGGGAYDARREIETFARARSIPIFRTWNALDIITDDSPVYCGTVGTYGGPGRNFGVQNCDLLLVLGCRLSGRITGGMPETFARGAKLYVVDVDPALLKPQNQQRVVDVNVLCDARQFAEALCAG